MKFWLLKLKVSFLSIGRLLIRPSYFALAIGLAAITLAVILWAFNISLLRFVLFESGLPVAERLTFLAGIYGAITTNFESGLAVTLVIFSVLFGINMAALVYVLKQRGKFRAAASKSAGGLAGAVIGAGCAACGTSILAPLLSAVGATGTIGLATTVGTVVNIVSIALVLFAIYSLGKVVANFQVAQEGT